MSFRTKLKTQFHSLVSQQKLGGMLLNTSKNKVILSFSGAFT